VCLFVTSLGCRGSGVVAFPNVCTILDGSYDDGALNPANPCQVCSYTSNPGTWTSLPDTTPCPLGICIGLVCQPGCVVDGGAIPEGPDPNDPCRSCIPATSTTDWIYLPDMTHCNPDGGAGAFCVSGLCNGCLSSTEVCFNGSACCSRLCDGQRCYDQTLGGTCEDDRSCASGNHCQQSVCCSPFAGVTCRPLLQGSWCCADAGLECLVNVGSQVGTCQPTN
jgi:hypothetical protein